MKKAQIPGNPWNQVHDQYRNEGLFHRSVCSNLAVMAMLPGVVLGQDELPNEVTWQKTQTSAQDPLPGHKGHHAAIVLPPKTDNCLWVRRCTIYRY